MRGGKEKEGGGEGRGGEWRGGEREGQIDREGERRMQY